MAAKEELLSGLYDLMDKEHDQILSSLLHVKPVSCHESSAKRSLKLPPLQPEKPIATVSLEQEHEEAKTSKPPFQKEEKKKS